MSDTLRDLREIMEEAEVRGALIGGLALARQIDSTDRLRAANAALKSGRPLEEVCRLLLDA